VPVVISVAETLTLQKVHQTVGQPLAQYRPFFVDKNRAYGEASTMRNMSIFQFHDQILSPANGISGIPPSTPPARGQEFVLGFL